MVASTIVNSCVAELANVVKHIKNPIRSRSVVLQATQYIGLGFAIPHIASNKRSVSTRQSFPELAQLNQAGTGIILKIVLRKHSKMGKLVI